MSCENVEIKKNEDNTIYIYKNNDCSNISPEKPLIDFGECYNIIKEKYNIDKDEDLIIAKVQLDNASGSAYGFYHPYTLEKLDSSPCDNSKIIVQEYIEIEKLEDSKEKLILNLIHQGINVFNISDRFYTDICYHYESPNGKDVPIKARITAFFPNVTLCDDGCENVGVDIQIMKAKCECKFIDLVNIDLISNNLYGQTIQDIIEVISELNIAVVKCFKDIFNKDYFIKNTGGFIIIFLFVLQLICFIKYSIDGLYYIRKYIFDLSQSFTNYINNRIVNNNINSPPRKKKGKSKSLIDENVSNQSKNGLIYNNLSLRKKVVDSIIENSKDVKKNTMFLNNKNNKIKITNLETTKKRSSSIYKKGKRKSRPSMKIKMPIKEKITESKINIKEYLSVSFDENDFDDVIDKDNRPFCLYFREKFKMNQIFINTLFIKEPLHPRSLKCLVLIMTIELYFVINALFYNEDYLTNLFYSTEEEKFYSFIVRRINHFIYTSTVSGIISYFVGYVFIEEEKIKKIFRRNKEGDMKLQYELAIIVQEIRKKFNTIIIFSLILTVICFIYISCFNNVYPNIKGEWINSSLFILILMQIINLAFTFMECLFRYIAIKCNSEKIFKLSQIFSL